MLVPSKRPVRLSSSSSSSSSLSSCDGVRRQSGSVESVIRKHASREVCWSSQGMLRLSTEAMRRLFQPTLERIKQAIGDVLNYPHARGSLPHTYITSLINDRCNRLMSLYV